MGIKFGEVDANQILENEFRINVLERLLDLVIRKSGTVAVAPSELEEIRRAVVADLQKKYPNSGISLQER